MWLTIIIPSVSPTLLIPYSDKKGCGHCDLGSIFMSLKNNKLVFSHEMYLIKNIFPVNSRYDFCEYSGSSLYVVNTFIYKVIFFSAKGVLLVL